MIQFVFSRAKYEQPFCNPNGRPAGPPKRNIMSEVLKQIVGETFMTTEGENPRDITRLEMLMDVLVRSAERGDKTCLSLVMRELRHIDDRDAVVNSPAEDALQKMKEASESLRIVGSSSTTGVSVGRGMP